MRYLIILLGLSFCSFAVLQKDYDKVELIFDSNEENVLPQDAFQITEVLRDAENLYFSLEYMGTCREHIFYLFADSTSSTLNIQIHHDSNNDVCRSVGRKHLQVAFKDAHKFEINIKGFKEEFELHRVDAVIKY